MAYYSPPFRLRQLTPFPFLQDSVRAAERELERMREVQRDYDANKSSNDSKLDAANVALKSTVVSKEEQIRKLERRLQWTEEENATKVSLLNKEKEGLMMELGLQTGASPPRGIGGNNRTAVHVDSPQQRPMESVSVTNSPIHITQAHHSHSRKKEMIEKNEKMKKKKRAGHSQAAGTAAKSMGFQDDLAETPNWPPGGGAALKARKKHGDGSGDAAEEGGQESYVHHKQQQHQQYGMPAPRAQEDSDGPGSVINKAADYLAMRRRREAERATTEANKKDLESAPNRRAENFSNEDDLDIENRNFQNSSVMVSSKSQPNLEVLEEDFDGEGNDFHGMMKDNAGGIARQSPGSNRKTKFPPLN